MGFKTKMCIFAVGVAAGVYYYIKRKRAKDSERLYHGAFREFVLNDFGDVVYMYSDEDDDADAISFYDSIDLDFDDDDDSSYCYDDVEDYLLEIDSEIRASQLISIGHFGRDTRPRFTIARKRLHNKRKKGTKKKRQNSKKTTSNVAVEAFNEECPICTDTFTDLEPFVTLDCKHRLHNACAFRMVRSVKNLACPLCRHHVEMAL